MRALRRHGGPKALQAVKTTAENAGSEMQDDYIRILSDWPTAEVAEDLLAIARQSENETHRTLALRGYLRLAGLDDVPPGQRLTMCKTGLEIASRDEERQLALGTLAKVHTADALAVVIPYLDNANVRAEAAAAALSIGEALLPKNAEQVAVATDKIISLVKNPDLLRRARGLRRNANAVSR